MTETLHKELEEFQAILLEVRRKYEADGTISNEEREHLDVLTEKINQLKRELEDAPSSDGGAFGGESDGRDLIGSPQPTAAPEKKPPTTIIIRGKIDSPTVVKVDNTRVDESRVKKAVDQALKQLERELSTPTAQRRIIAAMAKAKLSPSGGVDPYDELRIDKDITEEIWGEISDKILAQYDFDTRWTVRIEVDKAIHKSFDERLQELKKTVPRDPLQRLEYELKQLDKQITSQKARIEALEKEIADNDARLEKLHNTDGRTQIEIQGKEPPHPPWAEIDKLKKHIADLKQDLGNVRSEVRSLLRTADKLEKDIQAEMNKAPETTMDRLRKIYKGAQKVHEVLKKLDRGTGSQDSPKR